MSLQQIIIIRTKCFNRIISYGLYYFSFNASFQHTSSWLVILSSTDSFNTKANPCNMNPTSTNTCNINPTSTNSCNMNLSSVETIDAETRGFRVKTLRILGGTQIGLGIVCAILSLVGVIFDGVRMNKNCPYSYSYNEYHQYGSYGNYNGYYTGCHYFLSSTLFGFNITCLIFSGWVSKLLVLHAIIMCLTYMYLHVLDLDISIFTFRINACIYTIIRSRNSKHILHWYVFRPKRFYMVSITLKCN